MLFRHPLVATDYSTASFTIDTDIYNYLKKKSWLDVKEKRDYTAHNKFIGKNRLVATYLPFNFSSLLFLQSHAVKTRMQVQLPLQL